MKLNRNSAINYRTRNLKKNVKTKKTGVPNRINNLKESNNWVKSLVITNKKWISISDLALNLYKRINVRQSNKSNKI